MACYLSLHILTHILSKPPRLHVLSHLQTYYMLSLQQVLWSAQPGGRGAVRADKEVVLQREGLHAGQVPYYLANITTNEFYERIYSLTSSPMPYRK